MAEPIVYQFIAAGQGDVVAAFGGINAAANRSAKSVEKYVLAFAKYEEASKRVKPLPDGAFGVAPAAAQKSVSTAKRAGDQLVTIAQHAAMKSALLTQQAEEKRAGYVRTSVKKIEQELKREEAARERAAKRAEKDQEKATSSAISAGVAIGGAVSSAVQNAASKAATVIKSALREDVQLRETANRISINARESGTTAIDPDKLRREFVATSLAEGNRGIKAQDIAEAVQGFIGRTGDLTAARKFSSTFATYANASDSDVKDIAGVGAELFTKSGITSIEEMDSALAALYSQSKSGAFELKDAAAQFSKMSSAASRFGLDKGANGVRVLGGLSQIARTSTGSAEKTATTVQATFRQLIKESPKLLAQGVKVFNTNGTTRDIQKILPEMISKVGGSNIALKKMQLQDILGDEGIGTVSPLISAYAEASNATKGSAKDKDAAGVAAVKAVLDKAINAQGSGADARLDAAQKERDASAQMIAAWEEIKAKVGDEVGPQLGDMASKIPVLVKGFDPVIKAAGITATALSGVADGLTGLVKYLQDKGLIADHEEKKNLRPKEELAEVGKELADAKKIGPLSEEEMGKLSEKRLRQVTLQKKLGITDQNADDPFNKMLEDYAAQNNPELVAATEKERAEDKAKKDATSFAEASRPQVVAQGAASGNEAGAVGGAMPTMSQMAMQPLVAGANVWSGGLVAQGGAGDLIASMQKLVTAAAHLDSAADKLGVGAGTPSIAGGYTHTQGTG